MQIRVFNCFLVCKWRGRKKLYGSIIKSIEMHLSFVKWFF